MRKTIISIGFIIFFGTATAVAGEDTAEQIRHLLEKETIQLADAALHEEPDRKSTRLNSSHKHRSRMPSSA